MDAIDPSFAALDRIEAALARLAAATARAKEVRLAAAAETVRLEVDNEKLREAVGEALGQLDGLIAQVEAEGGQ